MKEMKFLCSYSIGTFCYIEGHSLHLGLTSRSTAPISVMNEMRIFSRNIFTTEQQVNYYVIILPLEYI